MTDPATSTVPTREVMLAVGGMTCASCAARVERNLNRMPGVEATVNYATATAHVRYPEDLAPDALVGTVEATGYSADLPPEDARAGESAEPASDGAVRLVVSALLTIPVVLLAMVRPWQFDGWQWVSLALATPVVVWGGVAVPPRSRGQRPARRRDDGHAHQHRRAGGVRLVRVRPGPRRRRRDRHADGRHAGCPAGPASRRRSTSRSPPASRRSSCRPLPGGGGRAGSGSALRALLELGAKDVAVLARDGTVDARRVPIEALARRRPASWSGPARRSPPTASSSRARRRSTRRMLTGEPVPVEVGPGDEVTGATLNTRAALVVRATAVGATPRSRRSPGWSSRRRPARPTCNGSPTGSRRCSCRS